MPSPESELPRISIIGGTGPEGRGLALRFAQVGHAVVIGSRSRERAEEAAEEIRQTLTAADATGMQNADAAAHGELIVVAIPYAGLRDTLEAIAGVCRDKIVVSAVAPVEFEDGRPLLRQVDAGSAAEEARDLLPGARVVSAFQVVDAYRLQQIDEPLDTDVLVCSDDVEARRTVVRLTGELPGARALSAGRLASSRYVEACTALLITINRIYKSHSGIKLTGVDR